ncbi:MAG: bifunctional phosphoglucose/phosphomannose isomerase [Thermoplasmatales archaeon]
MEYAEEVASLKDQISFKEKIDVPGGIEKIVIAGMGGSGIAGRIFQDLYTRKPVTLVNSYDIPEFVDSKTLFIAVSYSGNTEETIQAVKKAREKEAIIRGITSGGRLAELVDDPVIVPSGYQPRSAVGYLTIPILRGFELFEESEVDSATKLLGKVDKNLQQLRKIAQEIYSSSKIPVIFGTPGFNGVAYRWKTQFNENSKILAYSAYFPELNHNDTMALESTYRKEEFYFFVLTHKPLERQIADRIRITSKLCNIKLQEIDGEGATPFSNVFSLIHKGDYISYFLARKRGVDPRNVSIIENLKRELKEPR